MHHLIMIRPFSVTMTSTVFIKDLNELMQINQGVTCLAADVWRTLQRPGGMTP